MNTILHLGLGSFHRAHQALVLQQLHDTGDRSWSLASGNMRPGDDATVDALVAQRGAYTLETVTASGDRSYRRVESIREVVPYRPDLRELLRIAAEPATRIVSFTVTEAGYGLDANGNVDFNRAEIRQDLDAARLEQPVTTVYGALMRLLRARRRAGGAPVTLLSCDNLRQNGDVTRRALLQFVDAAGDRALLAWVRENTTCPNAMVDRITPRPPRDLIGRVREATGWVDRAPVMSEDFLQWAVEDDFCAGRPRWEAVGVEMVSSVAAHEDAKLRVLNASHSVVAWAGALAGHAYVHDAVRDERIETLARAFATNATMPSLQPSSIDLGRYRDVVLQRFSNAALADTLQRVAADSYAKFAGFIAPTIAHRLQNGAMTADAALPAALLLAFLGRWHDEALAFEYEDRDAALASARAICRSRDPVAAFCGERSLWGDVAGDGALAPSVRDAAARMANLAGGRTT